MTTLDRKTLPVNLRRAMLRYKGRVSENGGKTRHSKQYYVVGDEKTWVFAFRNGQWKMVHTY